LEPRLERFIIGVPPQERHGDVAVAVDEPRRHERVRGVERFVGVAREIGADLEDFATFLIDQYVGSRHRQIGTEDLPAGNRKRRHWCRVLVGRP